ncbi:Altered inheritance of mitochondria protein 39, mitochondrial [Maudiozyma exigua]|uniref:Altered inheritance of mitochondria protein 39, mitochondrial n=1 Tax=Maudiozyma exigua TaxID=34358 RepID=A0A9P6VVQ0_MAUEX|nr:Altered inheritance of mitochondria protein 39, mitochondrial [Kazachstania exigua]
MNKNNDTKHFFTQPDPTINNDLIESYRRMQRRKRLQTSLIIVSSLLITIIGYQICYKVVYLKRESFIAIGPSLSRIHKLNKSELKYLDIPYMRMIIRKRVIEKIISNDFIREQYGVPFKIDTIQDEKADEEFKIWSEDENLVIYGFKFKPCEKKKNGNNWHNCFGLFQWRFSVRSVNIHQIIEDLLTGIGIRYDKITIPEKQYGSFKNEYPIHDDDEEFDNYDRRRHICFIGNITLDDKSKIIYKGKYHVDTKFDEIYLLRKENDKKVKYLLHKDGKSNK